MRSRGVSCAVGCDARGGRVVCLPPAGVGMDVDGGDGTKEDSGDRALPSPETGPGAARDGGAPPNAALGGAAIGGGGSGPIRAAASGDGCAMDVVRDDWLGLLRPRRRLRPVLAEVVLRLSLLWRPTWPASSSMSLAVPTGWPRPSNRVPLRRTTASPRMPRRRHVYASLSRVHGQEGAV